MSDAAQRFPDASSTRQRQASGSSTPTLPLPRPKSRGGIADRLAHRPRPRPHSQPQIASGSSSSQTSRPRPSPEVVDTTLPRSKRFQLSALAMPFFGPQKALSAHVEVHLDSSVVDLVGGPTTGSSYSLPGTVVLTLPILPLCYEGRYRILHDLTIVFEGKAEYWDESNRYTPLRLHAAALPLIPSDQPILLPPCDPASDGSTVSVSLPFDLRIPGWLPPSLKANYASTTYGIIAAAEIGWSDKTAWSSRGRQSRFTPSLNVMHRMRSPYTPFVVRRHRMPSALRTDSVPRERNFTLKPQSNLTSQLECVVTVPEWADMYGGGDSLRLQVRFRMRDDRPENDTPRRKDDYVASLVELGMEIEEVQKFSSAPFSSFVAAFPLPSEQPNRETGEYRLMGPAAVPPFESVFGEVDTACRTTTTRACLLTENGEQRSFAFEGGLGISYRWRRLSIVLPLPCAEQSASRPNPDSDGPFLRVRHCLKTRIVLSRPGGDMETLVLQTPIRFATEPTTFPHRPLAAPPPYVSMFHENGDMRECDPLPLYTPAGAETTNVDRSVEAEAGTEVELAPPTPRRTSSLPTVHSVPSDEVEPSPSEDETSSSLSPLVSPVTSPASRAVKLPSIPCQSLFNCPN